MEEQSPAYQIFALGDSAITIELGSGISLQANNKVRSMQEWFDQHPFHGLRDSVTGYGSLSILYDPALIRGRYSLATTAYEFVKGLIEEAWHQSPALPQAAPGSQVRIPVCYEAPHAPDLDWLAETKGISKDDLIRLHCERTYYIFMIGFLPGFAYMAEVDPRLQVQRKERPVLVAAGSVGIAGNQTGIYPMQCPGGWQIIGRTPVRLFDPHASVPVTLKAGDEVQFYPIESGSCQF